MRYLGNVADVLLLVLSFVLLPYFGFLLLTSMAAIVRGRRGSSGLHVQREAGDKPRRFLVAIPAHDEEEGIAETVRSCLGLDYPRERFEVLVIADNCTDQTAARAMEAGARVLERSDAERRSKGYAIEYLIKSLRETGEFQTLDGIVIIDADSTVHPQLLQVFARTLDAGYEWVQCYDCVGNAETSWRTRVMAYAFSLINGVRLLGQVSLGQSASLCGNGMCLSTRGLDRVPWNVQGLTEDLEYSWTVRLTGGKIGFTRDAAVYATMLTHDTAASAVQRLRWESGRRKVSWKALGPVLRSPDLGPLQKVMSLIEVTMPSMVSLCLAYLVFSLFPAIRLTLALDRGLTWVQVFLLANCVFAALSLLLYLISPFLLSFLPWRFIRSLIYVPYYVLWKTWVMLRTPPARWVRTVREPAQRPPESVRLPPRSHPSERTVRESTGHQLAGGVPHGGLVLRDHSSSNPAMVHPHESVQPED